jgi:hypothetical protein
MNTLDTFDNIFDSTTDLTPAAPRGGPLELRAGDVIFIRVGGFLYGRVAAATGSWTSHVGVLHHCEDGRWWVAESAIPRARLTPLDRFLARSERGLFAIRRLRGGLTPEQEGKLVAAADRRLGAWYDLGFNYDSRRQFCSKFVHSVYAEALGFGPGRVERFSKLISEQPDHALGFWRWWFAGRIPLRRRTVTPASQAVDPRFVTIAEGELGASPVPWSPASEEEREASAAGRQPVAGISASRPFAPSPEPVSLAWARRVSFALKNRAS